MYHYKKPVVVLDLKSRFDNGRMCTTNLIHKYHGFKPSEVNLRITVWCSKCVAGNKVCKLRLKTHITY